MIAVLKPGASPERTQHLIHWLEEQNLGVHVSKGEYQTVLGLIGNTAKVDMEMIQSLDIVESVTRAVSYTHLDVYKRQAWKRSGTSWPPGTSSTKR